MKIVLVKKEAELLLGRYMEIKDMLEDHTSEHHDNMLCDIMGYYEDIEEHGEVDNDCLKKQVGLCEKLLYTYQSLDDIQQKLEYVYC